MPRYAVEQLLGRDEVRRETHPGVLLLDGNLRLVTSYVEAFFRDLNGTVRKDVPPDDAVPLWNAARTLGGRLKNWGEALALMRSGDIDFWLVPDRQRSLAPHSKFVRRVLVVTADVRPALATPINAAIRHGSVGWLRTDIERDLETLRLGDKPVLRRWRGGGGKLDITARKRSRAGQRISHEG